MIGTLTAVCYQNQSSGIVLITPFSVPMAHLRHMEGLPWSSYNWRSLKNLNTRALRKCENDGLWMALGANEEEGTYVYDNNNDLPGFVL